MGSKIVFFDIAGEDDSALKEFYSEIFGWSFSGNGECSLAIHGSTLQGAVRKDPKEKRLYLGVADVAETLRKIEAAGGSVDQPRFEVPGLVEMNGDEIVVP